MAQGAPPFAIVSYNYNDLSVGKCVPCQPLLWFRYTRRPHGSYLAVVQRSRTQMAHPQAYQPAWQPGKVRRCCLGSQMLALSPEPSLLHAASGR